jgi:hypothetical protein
LCFYHWFERGPACGSKVLSFFCFSFFRSQSEKTKNEGDRATGATAPLLLASRRRAERFDLHCLSNGWLERQLILPGANDGDGAML